MWVKNIHLISTNSRKIFKIYLKNKKNDSKRLYELCSHKNFLIKHYLKVTKQKSVTCVPYSVFDGIIGFL